MEYQTKLDALQRRLADLKKEEQQLPLSIDRLSSNVQTAKDSFDRATASIEEFKRTNLGQLLLALAKTDFTKSEVESSLGTYRAGSLINDALVANVNTSRREFAAELKKLPDLIRAAEKYCFAVLESAQNNEEVLSDNNQVRLIEIYGKYFAKSDIVGFDASNPVSANLNGLQLENHAHNLDTLAKCTKNLEASEEQLEGANNRNKTITEVITRIEAELDAHKQALAATLNRVMTGSRQGSQRSVEQVAVSA